MRVECNLVWNHTRDFKFCRARSASLIWYDFRPKIALLSFQLLYYSHFEIAKFGQYLYFIGPVAGLLKSGIENASTSYFVYEIGMLWFRAKRYDLEQKWCNLEQMWWRAKNSMFRENVITRLKANQIAKITCHFKMDVIKSLMNKILEMAAQMKVVHRNFSSMRPKTFFIVHP